MVFRLLLATLAYTPMPVARVLAHLYLTLIYWLAKGARRTALRNLEIAGFEDRERILRGVFDSIARLVVTFARFPRMNRENISAWIRYEGLENFYLAKRRGRGVLVATAHLGNWELCAFAHALLNEPVHIVVRPLDNPCIDELVERYRAIGGNRIIEKSRAARYVLRALAAGETVATLIDENMAADKGVFIDFFDVKACSSKAPASIARYTAAAVLPAYAVWSKQERRYVFHIEPEVEMTGDIAADTQRIQARLEAAIRKYPDQWLWTQKRWKTRPPDSRR